MYLLYLPRYDDFTIYIIMYGSHIGFLATRRILAIKIMLNEFLRVKNMGIDAVWFTNEDILSFVI